MQCLTDVYQKIFDEDIEMFDCRIKPCDAVTIEADGCYGIFFDDEKTKSTADKFIALAHEYGHCKSGATHRLYSPCQLIEQHENRANRTAVHTFLPYEKIEKAIEKGNTELWQIAEFLNMPEQFVKMAIDIYKLEGKL